MATTNPGQHPDRRALKPATLMALLWGVAYGWQQDARARQAQQIGDVAADLHQRFALVMRHLTKTGRFVNLCETKCEKDIPPPPCRGSWAQVTHAARFGHLVTSYSSGPKSCNSW